VIAELSAVGALAAAGASARWNWWRPAVTGGMPTLMYHKIGDYPPGSELKKLWVATADFRRQLQYLKDHGYTSINFVDWRDAEKSVKPLPAKPVLITFDDGYMNNYELAYPLLREFGMKGCVFLVYEMMDQHNAWHDPASEPWLKMLTWAQIKEMQDSGVIEFGSHTMKHRNLAALPLDEVRWELTESKKRLEDKLGRDGRLRLSVRLRRLQARGPRRRARGGLPLRFLRQAGHHRAPVEARGRGRQAPADPWRRQHVRLSPEHDARQSAVLTGAPGLTVLPPDRNRDRFAPEGLHIRLFPRIAAV